MHSPGFFRDSALQHRDETSRKEFWAGLSLRCCPGVGLRLANVLVRAYGSAYAAVLSVGGWTEQGAPSACKDAYRSDVWRQEAKRDWNAVKASPCGVLLWTDPEYPDWLKTIDDAPLHLFFYGDISLLSNVSVAVVGSRDCSVEGIRTTAAIARGLSEAGVTVVSGMARGIDRVAHLGALEGVGSSIAVLGTGVDVPYPRPNRDLRDLLMKKGLILSELAPDRQGMAGFFPVRNRIISGIARAVVVTEAASRSGSLNTARHALDQNRDLMAVPGPASLHNFRGCQELIRKGAKAVFRADDILRELLPELSGHARAALAAREKARLTQRDGSDGDACESFLPGLLPWQTEGRSSKAATAGQSRVQAAHDVGRQKEKASPPLPLQDISAPEEAVLFVLRRSPAHIDDISRVLGQNAGVVSGLLAMLEIKGLVRHMPGMVYAHMNME